MPRGHRPCLSDAVLHIVNRGNDRRQLYRGSADYEAFLGLLSWASARTRLRIVGYVVMPNHWHLVVWPESGAQLSKFAQRLTSAHAAILRRQTSTSGTGHVYQGRYWARVVTTDLQYLRTLRYVEANPVRAGLVPKAELWRWSSVQERLGAACILSGGPVAIPPLTDWLTLVNVPLAPEQSDEIRAQRPRSGIARLWPGPGGVVNGWQNSQHSQMSS